ncbi:uncharacterized protein LOC143019926 isoform X4 [Oratosquilla oratoria]
MIIVDETEPVGELPPPFPPRNVDVKTDEDMRTYYDLSKEIGRGRFGTVFLCNEKRTSLKFAAKFVNTKRNQDRQNVEREIEIMQTLNAERPHPRLIQLYDAFDIGKEMCLILEIVDGGELFERVIVDDFVLTERACAIFIRQICEGVEFIHSKNILHLDMKPENILCVSREGNRVKICDFGLARKYDPRKKLQVLFGTPEFVAPEVVNFEPISFGTDMWSIGVICYVLLSGLSPFMGHNYVETMTNVTHNKYDFDDDVFDDVSDEAKDFIEKLLVLDKSDRPTPAQCLRQPWLRKPPENMLHRSRIVPDSEPESESESETESEEEQKEKKVLVEKRKEEIIIIGKEKEEQNSLVGKEKEEIIIVKKEKEEEMNIVKKEKEEKEKSESVISETKLDKEVSEKGLGDKKKESELSTQVQRTDSELELTKSNLKEFVERWNSHPNSPYLIGTPTTTVDLQKLALAAGTVPRASFASMAVAPPSDHGDLSDFDETEIAELPLPQEEAQDSADKDSLTQSDREAREEVKKETLNIKIKDLQRDEKENVNTKLKESQREVSIKLKKSNEEEKENVNIKLKESSEKKEVNCIKLKDSNEEKKDMVNIKLKESNEEKKEVVNIKLKESKEEKKEVVNIKLEEPHEEKKEVVNIKLKEPNKEKGLVNTKPKESNEEKKKEDLKTEVKESRGEVRRRKEPIIYQTSPTTRKRTRDEAKSSRPVLKEGIFSLDTRVEVRRTRDSTGRKDIPKMKEETRKSKEIPAKELDLTKPTEITKAAKEESEQLPCKPLKEVSKQLPKEETKDFKGTSEDSGKQYFEEPLKRPEIIALQRRERRESPQQQIRRTDARSDTPLDAVKAPDTQDRTTKTSTPKRAPPSRDVPQKVITTIEKTYEGTVLKVSMPLIQNTQTTKIEKEASEIGSPRSSTPTRQGSRKGRSRDFVIQVAKLGDEDDQRAGTSFKQRPSRDVKLISQKSLEKDEKGSRSRKPSTNVSPDRSRGTTPTKQRKTSREERHSSRESERGGTPARIPLRRPSRDVPLTPSQLDILTSLAVETGTDSPRGNSPEPMPPQIQVWPDMIAVPQTRDETALELIKPQSSEKVGLKKSTSTNNLDINTMKVSPVASPMSSPLVGRKELKPVDILTEKEPPYTAQSKLVTWILDIGTPQQRTLPFSTSDRVSQWESKDKSPRPLDRKTIEKSPKPQEKPSVSSETQKEKFPRPQPPFSSSAQVDNSCSSGSSSSENLQVQTPWGTMKRSPSRTSLSKTPSLEIPKINIKETSEERRQAQLSTAVSMQAKPSPQTRTTSSEDTSQESSRKSQNEPVSINGTVSLSHSMSSDRLSPQARTRSPSPSVNQTAVKGRSPTPNQRELKNDTVVEKDKNTDSSKERSVEPKGENKPSIQSTKLVNSSSSERKEDSEKHSYPSKGDKPLTGGSDMETAKKKKPPPPPPIDTKKVNEAFSSDTLKRKSKFPPSPSNKKQFNVFLFSAQDRISQFEQKKEDKPNTRQRPLVRSKTVTHFTQQAPSSDTVSNDKLSSVCHQNKTSIAPPVVSTCA